MNAENRMKCAGCRQPVTAGQLLTGPHVQLPPGHDAGEQLLNDDGTPHRLTCAANNRHRQATEHVDYCGACKLETDCLMTYDRQGELHRCKLCGWTTYLAVHTRRTGARQRFLS